MAGSPRCYAAHSVPLIVMLEARRTPSVCILFEIGREPVQRVLAAAGLLILLLGPIAWWTTPAKHLHGKDKAEAINATRQIFLAAVGGLVLLTGAGFTARTFYLTRRGQLTDRYTKAIGLLASEKVTERIGGVFALEHLMAESAQDHPTAVEVLAAFVRERTRDLTRNPPCDPERTRT